MNEIKMSGKEYKMKYLSNILLPIQKATMIQDDLAKKLDGGQSYWGQVLKGSKYADDQQIVSMGLALGMKADEIKGIIKDADIETFLYLHPDLVVTKGEVTYDDILKDLQKEKGLSDKDIKTINTIIDSLGDS